MQHNAATKRWEPAERPCLDRGMPARVHAGSSARWTSVHVALALVLAACSSPSAGPSAGPMCGPNGECPTGLTCSAQLTCEDPGVVRDAGDGGSAPDASTDADPLTRTRAGLIGLWEFDETNGATGATVNDTSTTDAAKQVQLTITSGTVTFSSGTMTPNGIAVIASAPYPHVNMDVKLSQAVTLEAWVMASAADQGTATAPVVIAGTSSSINARNISLMQAGKRWIARVRTTASGNGLPDLIATADVTPGVMTHVVVVSDATHRMLYIDGRPDRIDPAPSPPANWDGSYRMVLGDELSQNRQWAGTFALVAMYQQALTDQLVETNYRAGPDAR